MSEVSHSTSDVCAAALPAWKLEDAKARFSEVVRLAREQGPQRVTVRGRDAVVVLSAAEYAHLAPAAAKPTLFALFADSPFAKLEDFGEQLGGEQLGGEQLGGEQLGGEQLGREKARFRDLPDF